MLDLLYVILMSFVMGMLFDQLLELYVNNKRKRKNK